MLKKGVIDIEQTLFIEPTTCRHYTIEESPYYTVEGVFNNKNFWININPSKGIDEINFEFMDDEHGEWE